MPRYYGDPKAGLRQADLPQTGFMCSCASAIPFTQCVSNDSFAEQRVVSSDLTGVPMLAHLAQPVIQRL